jgi:P27 family predicted phage terminase small subunit
VGGRGSGPRARKPANQRRPRGEIVPAQPGAVAIPRRPVGLADRGRREWVSIWSAGAGWLRPERDYHWIEQVVRAYDEIAAYRRVIRRDGVVQRGSQGQPVAHPLIAEVRKLEDRIDRNLAELGLSPSAAARLGLAVANTASKLDELAERRAKRAGDAPVTVTAEVVEVVDEW